MADLSFSAAQKALLLGAFFPVFTPFQVVAGPLVQIFGAKRLLSLNLGGMAALLLLLPSTASIGGTWAMATCLAGIGVCQGVLVPGQGQLKRNWLTDGPERVWALRIMGLGGRVGYTLASVLVPFLADRLGWRSVPYALGGFSAVFCAAWHVITTEHPELEDEQQEVEEKSGGAAEGTGAIPNNKPMAEKKSMEWKIFR